MSQTVTVSRRLSATPEAAFDAWLDPALARRFLFATPDGEMVRAETDPRVGGAFTFTDRRPKHGEVEHVGRYLEVDRPRRLAFTVAVPAFDARETTVAVAFAPDGDGTLVTLTHQGVTDEHTEQTRAGWEAILEASERSL